MPDVWFDRMKFIFIAFYSSAVTAASFYYFFSVSFYVIPEDNAGNVNIILGFLLGTAVTSFINYFFGSAMAAARTKKDKPPDLPVEVKNGVPTK